MNTSSKGSVAFKLVVIAGMVSSLAACGGDDPAPVTPPPVQTFAMTMTGTAATGAAIVNGNVTATCKTGTAVAVTDSKGAYTVKVPVPGEGPCIISVVSNGVTLRSIASGDGAKANVTPLTEMLVSYIAVSSGAGVAATPAQMVANANVKTIVTNATMMSATVNQMVQVIQAAAGPGVTVPTDFLSATLVPKDATNPGNAQDAILEALKTKNIVSSTGVIAPAVLEQVRQNAATHTVTGGTGGGG